MEKTDIITCLKRKNKSRKNIKKIIGKQKKKKEN